MIWYVSIGEHMRVYRLYRPHRWLLSLLLRISSSLAIANYTIKLLLLIYSSSALYPTVFMKRFL